MRPISTASSTVPFVSIQLDTANSWNPPVTTFAATFQNWPISLLRTFTSRGKRRSKFKKMPSASLVNSNHLKLVLPSNILNSKYHLQEKITLTEWSFTRSCPNATANGWRVIGRNSSCRCKILRLIVALRPMQKSLNFSFFMRKLAISS